MRSLPLGTAYSIWTGIGAAAPSSSGSWCWARRFTDQPRVDLFRRLFRRPPKVTNPDSSDRERAVERGLEPESEAPDDMAAIRIAELPMEKAGNGALASNHELPPSLLQSSMIDLRAAQ
ncbi:hypothetical protein [Paenirhodobacter populi]|uniref:hypothetical protein n=1 Tax=Paenirhodobacter populi TaxID=2306993 RepID=UPI003743917E